MSRITLIGGALLMFGLAGGVILDRSALIKASVCSTEGVSGAMPLTRLPATLAASAAPDADQLRAIIREELASAAARTPNDGRRASQANPAAVNSVSPQEQHQAVLRAESIIQTGQWGDAERSEFRQQLGLMSPEDRERVTQEWIQGMDSGSIKVSTTGPML